MNEGEVHLLIFDKDSFTSTFKNVDEVSLAWTTRQGRQSPERRIKVKIGGVAEAILARRKSHRRFFEVSVEAYKHSTNTARSGQRNL